ncbi:MAG: hypothetical protein MJA27_20930, partial [Pseudanabaenales cyanobacterium]|nr:hypothetical protein [Pseudanabaenales cyanobacterium]
MWALCWRWRVPPKTDDSGWSALAEKVAADAPQIESFELSLTTTLKRLAKQLTEASRVRDEAKRKRKTRSLRARIRRI